MRFWMNAMLVVPAATVVFGFAVVALQRFIDRRARRRPRRRIRTTKNGLLASLEYVQEWLKWMATIQGGGIAGLWAYASRERGAPAWDAVDRVFGVTTVWCLGAGLFCTAWLMSALASIVQRVDTVYTVPDFDLAEISLFHWTPWLRFLDVVALELWYSAVGVVLLVITLVRLLF